MRKFALILKWMGSVGLVAVGTFSAAAQETWVPYRITQIIEKNSRHRVALCGSRKQSPDCERTVWVERTGRELALFSRSASSIQSFLMQGPKCEAFLFLSKIGADGVLRTDFCRAQFRKESSSYTFDPRPGVRHPEWKSLPGLPFEVHARQEIRMSRSGDRMLIQENLKGVVIFPTEITHTYHLERVREVRE